MEGIALLLDSLTDIAMFRRLAAGVLISLVPLSAAHAAQEDEQIWLAQFSTINLDKRVLLFAEAQMRLTDGADRPSQFFLRPALGYQVTNAVSVYGGYAWVRVEPLNGAAVTEHRAYQQLSVRLAGGPGKVAVNSRTRLEQRFIVGRPDMGWRLRSLVRVDVPLGKGFGAIVTTEPFANLDTTTWGQRAGFDQIRGFAGIGIPVARGIALEAGYAGQYTKRFAAPDRMNHIGSVSFNIRR